VWRRSGKIRGLAEQTKHANGSGEALKTGAETNQPVYGHADEEIHQDTCIHLKTLVLQRFGKVPVKRKVIDGIAYDYGDQVLQPSPGSCAEDLLLIRQGSVPSAGAAVDKATPECPKGGQASSYSSGSRV
jgi:hypothetical protein